MCRLDRSTIRHRSAMWNPHRRNRRRAEHGAWRTTTRTFDLAALADDELVEQMHNDLYDGMAPEIVEARTSCSGAAGAGQGAQRRPRRGHAHRRHRLPRRHPVRARGPARRERDEGRHGILRPAARRDRREADRQGRHRHGQGRHPRHRQEPGRDDARGRRLRGLRPRASTPTPTSSSPRSRNTSRTSSGCRRCSRRRCRT